MKKILIIPNSKEELNRLLKEEITGVIIPIKHLSVNSNFYLTIEEVNQLDTKKEIGILVNKIMMNKDLILLEKALKEASNKISKILFYDLAVLNIAKKINSKQELVIFQDHLNANNGTNLFYKKRGVSYTVITNDITKEEINEISKYQKLMIIAYGYLPIFYSRRYLITNYLSFIGKEKKNAKYELKEKNDKYRIEEEEEGTTIYTKEPINLINKIKDINVEYIILNENNIEKEKFINVLKSYQEEKQTKEDNYIGFLEKKTVYQVKDYE